MKKVSLFLFIAAGMLAMSAQQKVMRIHHAYGTSEDSQGGRCVENHV